MKIFPLRHRPIAYVCTSLAILILIGPNRAVPQEGDVLATQTGKASYYGKKFDGRKTASGERFNSDYPVAAHPRWPFGTLVRVTNLKNGRVLKVRIIDRGPTKRRQRKGIIIDVSLGAAKVLGFVKQGITKVRLEVLKWGKKKRL